MNRSGDYRYVLPAEFAWLARNASNPATAGGACSRHMRHSVSDMPKASSEEQRWHFLAAKPEPDAALYSGNLTGRIWSHRDQAFASVNVLVLKWIQSCVWQAPAGSPTSRRMRRRDGGCRRRRCRRAPQSQDSHYVPGMKPSCHWWSRIPRLQLGPPQAGRRGGGS